ncbi:hypothetical protein J4Q44_G00059610 [Coregonus suidteri]|uniref:Uncharacterized protein n=1 Tax=Coregonus suidteri TaxID=861788 RepID=A0AAN8MBU0_9TELE
MLGRGVKRKSPERGIALCFPPGEGETRETAGAMRRRGGLEREETSPFIILSIGQRRKCIQAPQRLSSKRQANSTRI